MKIKFIALALALSSTVMSITAENLIADYEVVPLPQTIEAKSGASFMLNKDTKILYPQGDADMARNAAFLAEYITDNLGFTPAIEPYDGSTAKSLKAANKQAGVILLGYDKAIDGNEAYSLEVSPVNVKILSSAAAGAFYGVQTLRKALPVMAIGAVADAVEMPAVKIADAPRFGYRGMLLDTARHYIGMDGVKQFIDLMAMHNMNVFHWHITDDQGWRLELKNHPEIVEKGHQRSQTIFGRYAAVYDGIPYGGYYTQDDVKEILKYAADRYITVMPEIDMPGHTLSLLASHPEIGCTGGPYIVSPHWGVHPDILCGGKEATYKLCEEILDEVCELFPSEYIYIGGDEAPKDRWRECPDCQAKIKELGIEPKNGVSAEHQLQGYFTKRLEKYLNSKGRKAMGWEEIYDAGVNPSTSIMAWHGFEYIVNAANSGHDVVGGSSEYNYLDYSQHRNFDAEPLLIGGRYLPLSKCYQYEPMDPRILPENRHHLLGVQGFVWGEFIGNNNLMAYQMLPRMAAICESQWIDPDKKIYHKFLPRLRNLTHLYDRYQYSWCRGWE